MRWIIDAAGASPGFAGRVSPGVGRNVMSEMCRATGTAMEEDARICAVAGSVAGIHNR
jgi:hypothetical protein